MQEMPYIDIVIIGLIAAFILLRLRGVLGQKTGFDGTPAKPPARKEEESLAARPDFARIAREEKSRDDELLARLESEDIKAGLAAIGRADANFRASHFMEGARSAFEMVFDAFHKGDRDVLRMLLAPKLYDVFTGELERRKESDHYTDTTLLSVESQEILSAALEGNLARVRVRFVSEQVSVVRDGAGKIVEGNPGRSEHVEDEWLFERDIHSKNPNWKIIET